MTTSVALNLLTDPRTGTVHPPGEPLQRQRPTRRRHGHGGEFDAAIPFVVENGRITPVYAVGTGTSWAGSRRWQSSGG